MSSEALREAYQTHLETAEKPVKMIIVDMEAVNFVDVPGADTLKIVAEELQSKNIEFHLSSVHSRVYAILENDGVIEIIGTENIHPIMGEAISYFKKKYK